jgi:hypothetical protein
VEETKVGAARGESLCTDVQIFDTGLDCLCNNLHMETSTFALAYVEKDPRTKEPSASVYAKEMPGKDFAGITSDRLLMAPCLNFIELDTQIRRLHAELDEIRAQAKKKFYRAHAATAGV